ncbi:MAG: hypothetical protein ACJAYV_002120 [Oleispira sp.]|jgi:hypothetical protein
MNANSALLALSDIASQAHEKIQQDFEHINPIIGVMQGMRKTGIPADVMTIDCLVTNKRILIVLHDESPKFIQYQFIMIDQNPGDDYQQVAWSEATSETVYAWIKENFSTLQQ